MTLPRRYRGSILLLVMLIAAAIWIVGCQQDPEPSGGGQVTRQSPSPSVSSVTPTLSPTPRAEVTHHGDADYPCGPSLLRYDDWELHEHFLHWANGSSHLVFNLDDTVWTVDAGGTQVRQVADANPGPESDGKNKFLYGYHAHASAASPQIVYATCEYSAGDTASVQDARASLGYEIATVNVDGTGRQRLTKNGRFDSYPVLSPDGTRIAFIVGDSDGHYSLPTGNLFVMAADGSDGQRVGFGTDTRIVGAGLYPPIWSPDGERLAFIVNEAERSGNAYRDSYEPVLYTIRLDGSGLNRIGETTGLPGWSPDNQQIAFARVDGDETGIYTAQADGSRLRQVMGGFGASQVSWSPEGSELLFVSNGVYVVALDGSGLRRVGIGDWPVRAAWSSDGSKIAIYYPGELLVTVDPDGTRMRVLLEGNGRSLHVLSQARQETTVDLSQCSGGFVVPEPEANPGLVADCETLLALRDTLAGSGRLPWVTDSPIKEWLGVTVSGSPPRVHELVLVDTGLTGTLPPALGRLTALRKLNISTWMGDPARNRLTGSIPGELGGLAELKELRLDANTLSGSIPAALGNLSQLQILALADNSLVGSIPLEPSGFEKLEVLIVGNNNFSGNIPIKLTGLSRLRLLDLSGNLFTGGIPPELGRFSRLESLNLSDNPLGGDIPPELGSLELLYYLDLSFTGLDGNIPQELGGLRFLSALDLSSNQLTGSIPPEMSGLENLTWVGIVPNNIDGCVPAELSEMWVEQSQLDRCDPAEAAGT